MLSTLSAYWNVLFHQSTWIPAPPLTEHNLPSQRHRVFIVTGGNTGVGFHLCTLLYRAHGTVYLASRSADRGRAAIERIRASCPESSGRLQLLELDLADLAQVKRAAESFLAREEQLHVLVNNAGVMVPRHGIVGPTAQDHEMQFGVNCLGPWLFTQLLKPLLALTARAAEEEGSVRVAWAGSAGADLLAPKGGVAMEGGAPRTDGWSVINYTQSKAGNYFLAEAFGREMQGSGVVSVSFNPGNLHTELNRHTGTADWIQRLLLYPAVYGAYTELYCALSPELTAADNGAYIVPWGRKSWCRADIEAALTDGTAERFVEWCRRETEGFK